MAGKKGNNKGSSKSKFRATPPHVKRGKKLGLKYSKTGNVIIPTKKKQIKAFNDKVLRDEMVMNAAMEQRRGQRTKGAKKISGNVVDELLDAEEKGFNLTLLQDMFAEDDVAGEVTVSKAPKMFFKSTALKYAASVVMVAYNRGIDLDQTITIPGLQPASYGECVFWRLILEIFTFAKGDVSLLQAQHRDINSVLCTLTPRIVARADGQQFSYWWENLIDQTFDDYFQTADLIPGVGAGVTIGGIFQGVEYNYARWNRADSPNEQQILDYCTDIYMEVITQMANKDGSKSLIDPQLWFPERETSAAFSVPTGFGEEETSFRFWANVRNEVRFDNKYLAHACTGWVDSTLTVDDAEALPVRTIQHVNVSHLAYRLNRSGDYRAGVSIPILVYPKIVQLETMMIRASAILVTGDMKVTSTEPDYVAQTITQKTQSVIRGMINAYTTFYYVNVLVNCFFDTLAGAFALPTGYSALAGSCFKPNPLYRAAPWPTQMCENTALLGPSIVECEGEYNELFQRVTLPILCVEGGSVSANFSNSVSWQALMSSMYPNIGGNDYQFFTTGSVLLDGYVPFAQATGPQPDAYVCGTSGSAVGEAYVETAYAWNTLQPAVDLSFLEPMHNPKSYSYDSVTKLIQRPLNPTNISAYAGTVFAGFVTTHLFKSLLDPAYIEVTPTFIVASIGDNLDSVERAVNAASAMFGQTKRVTNQFSPLYNDIPHLAALDLVYATHCVGSQYEGPQTGITHIYNHRLVCGEGGFWAILRAVSTGLEVATHVGAELADVFGRKDVGDVIRKINKGVHTVNKFIPPVMSRQIKAYTKNMKTRLRVSESAVTVEEVKPEPEKLKESEERPETEVQIGNGQDALYMGEYH